MKKIILYISFLFLGLVSANAQINLEHTFTTDYGVTSFMTSTHGLMYYSADSSQVKVYNSDYSLYKTITLPGRPVGAYGLVYFFSDNLFDLDSGIEFQVAYLKAPKVTYKIIDDDGTVLKDLGEDPYSGGSWGNPFYVIGTGSAVKLLRSSYDDVSNKMIDEIYSLPGTAPSNVNLLRSATLDQPAAYPNPAVQIINIPYILEAGQTTTLIIYNQSGMQIEQKTIDSTFKEIRLNVSRYTPGLYLFKYNNMSGRFIVK